MINRINGWIPVEEALPFPKTEVLASFSDGTVDTIWQNWVNSEGTNYPGEPLAYIARGRYPETPKEWKEYKVYVTAWMPIPKAYKKEKM